MIIIIISLIFHQKLLSEKDEKNHINFKKSAQILGKTSPLSVCSIIWGQHDLTFPFIFEPSYRGHGFRPIFSARFWNSENIENVWKSLNVTHFESLSRDCSVEQRLKKTCLKSWKFHEITRFLASTFAIWNNKKAGGVDLGRFFWSFPFFKIR